MATDEPIQPKTRNLFHINPQLFGGTPKYRSSWYNNAILLVGEKVFFHNERQDDKNDKDDKDADDEEEGSTRCSPQSMGLWNLTTTSFFEMYIQTLGFGLLLYVADTISDIFNAVIYYLEEDYWWSGLTVAVVLLPGIVRGTYEVFRRQIVYKSLANDRTQRSPGFSLESQNLFPRLNLGLDVLPSFSIDLETIPVVIKIFLAVFYVIVMAIIFPFLPIVQYCKVFRLQWKLKYKKSERPFGEETIFEEATEEMRRAVSLKAVEAFMEAAPQFFLQIYITYKRKQDINSEDSLWSIITPFVAMGFSFLSLLKTSYDLQEVDRLDHAVSSAARPITFFWTSNFFFSTVICFRSLAISVLSLFLSHYLSLKGIIAFPLAVLFILNVLIRMSFQRSGALLAGAMSAVAPAKFFCSSKKSRERKTRNYLIIYTLFNTGAHVAGIVTVYILNPELEQENLRVDKTLLWLYFLPALVLLAIASTFATYLHWRYSLKYLFRADVKFPEYSKVQARLKTYTGRLWQGKNASVSAKRLSENGLFCQTLSTGPRLCCYDCGLLMPLITATSDEKDIDERISLMHAALLFGYRIHYQSSFESSKASKGKQNPDILRQAYSRLIRVKPVCGVLQKKSIDFANRDTRLKSFGYMSVPGDMMKEFGVNPQEVVDAGYVRMSNMTAACFFCHHVLDWSNTKTRYNSPWALHAWNKSDANFSECEHMTKRLKDADIRKKTYPKEWLEMHSEPNLTTPESLADAGFYCNVWQFGRAWIKCFACSAYAVHWPKSNIVDRHHLAAAAKLTTTEIPGLAYAQDGGFAFNSSEVPIVDHYLQQPNCCYLQSTFQSYEKRLQTFPENWAAINGLAVSVESVAHANFIYFPNDETERKFRPNQIAKEKCSVTQCPKCLMTVDWVVETRHPRDILHCDARNTLLKQITQMRKNESSENIIDEEGNN